MRRAFLDACVLYPAPLRDLLMTVGLQGPIRLHWSRLVHQEWMRNLIHDRPDLSPSQVERTRDLMDIAMPEAEVRGFESLLADLDLPDPDDRHVLAAAIHAGCEVIVTWNLRDFPVDVLRRHHLRRETPDAFLVDLLQRHPTPVIASVVEIHRRLRRPSRTLAEILDTFEAQRLVRFVAELRLQQGQAWR